MNENMGVTEQVSVEVVRHSSAVPWLLAVLAIALAVYVFLLLRQRRKDGIQTECD